MACKCKIYRFHPKNTSCTKRKAIRYRNWKSDSPAKAHWNEKWETRHQMTVIRPANMTFWSTFFLPRRERERQKMSALNKYTLFSLITLTKLRWIKTPTNHQYDSRSGVSVEKKTSANEQAQVEKSMPFFCWCYSREELLPPKRTKNQPLKRCNKNDLCGVLPFFLLMKVISTEMNACA